MNMKNPAEKNFIVYLTWLNNKRENGVLNSIIWCDSRDMTADGRAKGSIRRIALNHLMNGLLNISHPREKLKLLTPHAKFDSTPGLVLAVYEFPATFEMAGSSSTAPPPVADFPVDLSTYEPSDSDASDNDVYQLTDDDNPWSILGSRLDSKKL